MTCKIFISVVVISITFWLKSSYGLGLPTAFPKWNIKPIQKRSFGDNWTAGQSHNMYGTNNEILALREELQVDGLEEDSSFKGGKGVESWIVLPSFYDTYLIGVKERGLSLISLSKRSGDMFQAVEKQIDLGKNITSVVAFNYINPNTQQQEAVVVVSTNTPKHEIIWLKILNYKLVKFWSWIRYTGTKSLHHFYMMGEDMLIVLDSSGLTAYVYSLSFSSSTPKIRELEVLPFSQKVISLCTSLNLADPLLYTLHEGGLGIYTYIRFCSEAVHGSFLLHTMLRDMGITRIYPFHSEGREYLAIAGKESGVLMIDTLGNVNQEKKIESIMEWIIMKTGPNKERILLFGKHSNGTIHVFSNVGNGWKPYAAPPCYKIDKKLKEKTGVQLALSCLELKSWSGVASLEIGDLPTLIFGDRRYYGEMYYVMLSITRDVLPLHQTSFTDYEPYNYLMRLKNNLNDVIDNIGNSRSSDNTCSILDMISAIEDIATTARERIGFKCPRFLNTTVSTKSDYNIADQSGMPEGRSRTNVDSNYAGDVRNNDSSYKVKKGEKIVISSHQEDILNTVLPFPAAEDSFKTKVISPDLEDDSQFQGLNSISGDFNINTS